MSSTGSPFSASCDIPRKRMMLGWRMRLRNLHSCSNLVWGVIRLTSQIKIWLLASYSNKIWHLNRLYVHVNNKINMRTLDKSSMRNLPANGEPVRLGECGLLRRREDEVRVQDLGCALQVVAGSSAHSAVSPHAQDQVLVDLDGLEAQRGSCSLRHFATSCHLHPSGKVHQPREVISPTPSVVWTT